MLSQILPELFSLHANVQRKVWGHLCIPGDDPKKEWLGLQQWLKNIRATIPNYDRNGSGRFVIEPIYYNLLVSAGVTVRIQTKPV